VKGITLRSPGGLDKLELTEMPDPGVPGPGEIRVRVHAVAADEKLTRTPIQI
jgi:NADPH:quinone reductase-like Zn-dependent oxidoreductase